MQFRGSWIPFVSNGDQANEDLSPRSDGFGPAIAWPYSIQPCNRLQFELLALTVLPGKR
jgi:hypothetical protein